MRILVVEDEPAICEFLKEGLETRPDFEVDTAADRSSVEMARHRAYDLVIADMHLSDDLDGLSIIEEISEFDRNVRFIVMTGNKRLDIAKKLVTAIKGNQVASFLFKPFDLEELIIAVDRIRKTAAESDPVSRQT